MTSESVDLKKRLVMTVQGIEQVHPQGLDDFIRRKGITNPAVVVKGGNITMLARLIYQDSKGENSAIVRHDGKFRGDDIMMFPGEEIIFPPEGQFGGRGKEDFRTDIVRSLKNQNRKLVILR